MTLFQILTLPIIALLLIRSVRKLLKGAHPRGLILLKMLIWTAAGVAIFDPDLTIRAAKLLGIGRGADLVLYFTTIFFLLGVLYFYNRLLKLETQITQIVRHLAIDDAEKKQGPDTRAGHAAEKGSSSRGPTKQS
jgi:hypothetical protein